jgi:hexosaminidase
VSRPGIGRTWALAALLVPVPLALTSLAGRAGGRVTAASAMDAIIPKPLTTKPRSGAFALTAATRIAVRPGATQAARIAEYLAEPLRRATGFPIPVVRERGATGRGTILLASEATRPLGPEGYEVTVTPPRVTLLALRPEGIFRGVQTLRQLLPASIEARDEQPGPWTIPAGTIRDAPRFAWRGAMLDVARHFFGVDDVKRYIDLMALYKLNRLHLHLTDDQGWRIAIRSWPRLATYGGSTQVGGGRSGYYTQAQYSEIVEYAKSRYIVIVPEIDMPGHTNAALASYPKLTCDGVAPPLYTGNDVGFSSLCVDREATFRFVDDVVREVAALTPGPWLHVGGDEAAATAPDDYRRFVERVQRIVRSHGKRMIGWEEIGRTRLLPSTLAQHWHDDLALQAVRQGSRVIMSPATKTYLDIKYDASTRLGTDWAGYNSVRDAYEWDPARQVAGVSGDDVLGVEAPLWTETIASRADLEFMAFPRLLGLAEIGWSPPAGRSWGEYRRRLAAHGPRLTAMEVGFYRAPEVPWR